MIELYEYLTAQLIKITKKVLEFARSKKYNKKVQLLRTVPGIGTLIAIEMLVELQVNLLQQKNIDRKEAAA